MSKFTPLPREAHSDKEANVLSKRCRRFNPFYQLWGDSRRGVIFLKLREEGCNKKTALAFSSKPICREDSTRFINGPATCRTLKVKNHSLLTSNGWQFNDLFYDLGKRFYTSSEEVLKIDEFDDLLQKHFLANEEKIKGDFKKKIKNLSDFYAGLNQKFNFSHLSKKDLFEKLKKMKDEYLKHKEQKKDIERKSIPYGNLKMKSLASETLQSENNSPSLITDLSVFPKYKLKNLFIEEKNTAKISTPPKLDISGIIQGDLVLKKRQSLENAKIPSPLIRQNTTLTENLSNSETVVPKPKSGLDLAKMKEKASLFRNLEAQNKFINAITNEETFSDIMPDTKRKLMGKQPPPPIITNTSTFPTKSLIAEEFNRANYMFGNDEERKTTAISPKSTKQRSILKHRRTLKSIRMGFAPEDLETKTHQIQKKQNLISQNIRHRKKDVSFILPENGQSDNKSKLPRTSQEMRPTYLKKVERTKQSISSFSSEDNLMKKNKLGKTIGFSEIPLESEYFVGDKEDKNSSYDEDDEIEREIKFQRDLKNFVKGSISFVNTRKGSINVDTGNLEEVWSGIKEMRKENGNLGKISKKTQNEKAKNLKNLMSSTYQNFFQQKPKTSSKRSNSKSTNNILSAKNSLTKISCFN